MYTFVDEEFESMKVWICWQTKEKWLSVWYTYYTNCRMALCQDLVQVKMRFSSS